MAKAEDRIYTPTFRVAYPNVFKPTSFNNGPEKYSVCMIFNLADIKTDDHQLMLYKKLRAKIKAVACEKWGPEENWPEGLRMPIRDGKTKKREGFGPGTMFANASSHYKPGIVDEQRNNIITPEDFYPGCYAHATVNIFWYPKNPNIPNKGVSIGLYNIQKIRDGDPLVRHPDPTDEFDALSDAGDVDDLLGDGIE